MMKVEKAVDWAKRAREYGINDDGEQMFLLIFEIWNDERK